MGKISIVVLVAVHAALVLLAFPPSLDAQPADLHRRAPVYARKGSFLFTRNIGQWERLTEFQGRSGSMTVRFRKEGIDYFHAVDSIGALPPSRRSGAQGYTLSTEFLGADPDVRIEGMGATATRMHYYLGPDPSQWKLDAPVFESVRYSGLYPGIDAIYSDIDGRMKYEFVIAPGADYHTIRLLYRGAQRLSIGNGGELEATTPFGIVRDAAPYCYQMIDGRRVQIEASYRLLGGLQYGFRLGPHDRERPVVIDPCLSIEYGTYLGGGGYDVVSAMAVDSSGFAYAVGFTNAIDFPIRPRLSSYLDAGNYVFISKITEDGSNLVYSTVMAQPYTGPYIATGTETYYESIGEDVEVTADGAAVIALTTNIENLATTPGVYRSALTPGNPDAYCQPPIATVQPFDFYIARLDASGRLQWGTYLGGSDNDYVRDIALDKIGNIWITGMTYSQTCADSDKGIIGDTLRFPVTVPKERFSTTDTLKGFETVVAKLSDDGRRLDFSAVYGGRRDEFASKIGVDAAGRVYLFGSTNSPDLRTTANAYQQAPDAGLGSGVYDLYIAQIDPTTATLLYSTYFSDGGGAGRRGLGVGVFTDRSGRGAPLGGFGFQQRHQGFTLDRQNGVIVFGGTTRSGTLPVTPGALRSSPPSPEKFDGFVVRFDITTNRILTATYIGGSEDDYLGGISIDAFGDIAVGVSTASPNFPLSAVNIQKDLRGKADGAIAIISSDGTRLEYGSYIGGSAPSGFSFQWEQSVTGVLTESTGALYLYGATSSRDLPITGSAFLQDNDYYSGYIIKFTAPSAPRVGIGNVIEFQPNTCNDLQTIDQQIFNSGQAPLKIDSIKPKFGNYFRLVNPPSFPVMLDPCDTITVTVGFLPDTSAPCDRTLRDSLIVYASNAVVRRSALYLTGIKGCVRFTFAQTEINDPRYRLGSNALYHLRASVQGEQPQYLTIEPDPGNKGVFRPSPEHRNTEYYAGTAFVDFEIAGRDTGYFCETFNATIQPCNRRVQLRLCAHLKAGFFNGPDSIAFGVISCREIEQPITIYNTGNDTLKWRIWFVGGDNGNDIEFEPELAKFGSIPEHDTVTVTINYRPKGIGQRKSIIVFETDEPKERRNPKLTITSELDTVSFALANPSLVGGYGDILTMPVSYRPIRDGRIPTTELTFLVKYDSMLLAVQGVEPGGTLTDGWEMVEKTDTREGTIIRLVMKAEGRPLIGSGELTKLRLKVLRGDTIATPLSLALAGLSKGCLTAEVDTTQLFMLSEECRAFDRLLYSDNRLLKQSLPNPAHDEVLIPFRVPEAGRVTLRLYDMLGREVLTLLDEHRAAGNTDVRFRAGILPAGRYYYRLTVGETLSDTREMVIR